MMGKIAEQIQYLLERQKTNELVKMIGYPDSISPQDLIILQWERIYTIENALRMPESHTKGYKRLLESSLCGKCKEDSPCQKDLEKIIKLKILREILI